MNIDYQSFFHLLFISIIALFPVVNPVGTAFIIAPYFDNLSRAEKMKAVGKITFYTFLMCTVALLVGHWILQLFGLSIPVIQLAGGIMICKIGWEFLASDKKSDEASGHINAEDNVNSYAHLQDKLFYPITFPITAGTGAISVLFTLSAHSNGGAKATIADYLVNTGAIILAVVVICILVYIFYLNTKIIINYVGPKGATIINRITAFLIFCVGLQIAVSGITSLVKGI